MDSKYNQLMQKLNTKHGAAEMPMTNKEHADMQNKYDQIMTVHMANGDMFNKTVQNIHKKAK